MIGEKETHISPTTVIAYEQLPANAYTLPVAVVRKNFQLQIRRLNGMVYAVPLAAISTAFDRYWAASDVQVVPSPFTQLPYQSHLRHINLIDRVHPLKLLNGIHLRVPTADGQWFTLDLSGKWLKFLLTGLYASQGRRVDRFLGLKFSQLSLRGLLLGDASIRTRSTSKTQLGHDTQPITRTVAPIVEPIIEPTVESIVELGQLPAKDTSQVPAPTPPVSAADADERTPQYAVIESVPTRPATHVEVIESHVQEAAASPDGQRLLKALDPEENQLIFHGTPDYKNKAFRHIIMAQPDLRAKQSQRDMPALYKVFVHAAHAQRLEELSALLSAQKETKRTEYRYQLTMASILAVSCFDRKPGSTGESALEVLAHLLGNGATSEQLRARIEAFMVTLHLLEEKNYEPKPQKLLQQDAASAAQLVREFQAVTTRLFASESEPELALLRPLLQVLTTGRDQAQLEIEEIPDDRFDDTGRVKWELLTTLPKVVQDVPFIDYVARIIDALITQKVPLLKQLHIPDVIRALKSTIEIPQSKMSFEQLMTYLQSTLNPNAPELPNFPEKERLGKLLLPVGAFPDMIRAVASVKLKKKRLIKKHDLTPQDLGFAPDIFARAITLSWQAHRLLVRSYFEGDWFNDEDVQKAQAAAWLARPFLPALAIRAVWSKLKNPEEVVFKTGLFSGEITRNRLMADFALTIWHRNYANTISTYDFFRYRSPDGLLAGRRDEMQQQIEAIVAQVDWSDEKKKKPPSQDRYYVPPFLEPALEWVKEQL